MDDPFELKLARDELLKELGDFVTPPAAVLKPGDLIPALNPDLLRDLGLPPRPDATSGPRLLDRWTRVVGGQLRMLTLDKDWKFVIRPVGRLRVLTRHLMGGESGGSLSGATGAIRGRWGTSRNWSGAVIAARDGGKFTRVEGSWTVPAAAQPAGPVPAGEIPGGVWKQSVWIGIDGYKLSSKSLPQLGTVSMFDPEKVGTLDDKGQPYAGEYYGWIQWWVRNELHGEAVAEGFPVAAGDRITASLTVRGPEDVLFVLRNDGPADAPTPPVGISAPWASGKFFDKDGKELARIKTEGNGDLNRSKAPAEGQHAVWCVERPAVMPPKNRREKVRPNQIESFLLPSFGGAVFTDALAEMRLPDGTTVTRDLTAARKIRMIDVVKGPRPRVVFATSPLPPDRAKPASTSKESLTVEQLGVGA